MAGKYSCVVFDLDGTLLDTSSGIFACTSYVASQYGLPAIPEDVMRRFIGPPIQDSFQRYLGCGKERAWELATAWREAYKEIFLLKAKPYDGIYELLHGLRQAGIKTAVATNKREDYTLKLLAHFDYLPLFDCIVGSDFEGRRSKAEMIRICMERLGVTDSERCLMVGDTVGDHDAALAAGTRFLGVTYGFGYHRRDELPEKDAAENCMEIFSYIGKWE